ncbi:30S ribosomal protein THX [Phytohalomonas tamaricis]
MARGDHRSKRGKIARGTYGRRRPKTLRQKLRRLKRTAG